MVNVLKSFAFLMISIFLFSCVQKQAGSSFETLGRLNDGDISFSFENASGTAGVINQGMSISPTKLTSINSSITNCRIKPGTTALPTGFSVNPITCAITGVPTARLDDTTYVIEVTNNKGKVSYAQVVLNAKTYYTLSGTVSGLPDGQTLTISNGVDTLIQTTNGVYYLNSVLQGSSYNVTFTVGNSNRFTCSITNASGVANSNISNANIACVPSGTRILSGTLSGLLGSTQVVISTNGSSLTLNTNGQFQFPAMNYNTAYNVVVNSATGSQTCLAAANTGNLTDDISTVSIVCQYLAPNYFSLIGTVSGLLSGQSVTLSNGADSQLITADKTFTLNSIQGGTTYNVTAVTGDPSIYSCTVTNGSGTISSNVTNIQVVCGYSGNRTVGGTIIGLTNGAVVGLTVNGVTQSSLTNGNFTFTTPYSSSGYTISIASVSTGYSCNLNTTSGSLIGNVSGLSVVCGPLGPYNLSVKVSGITYGTLSVSMGVENSTSIANETYTFNTQKYFNEIASFSTTGLVGHTCTFPNNASSYNQTITGATTVNLTCQPNKYTIGGSISGLTSNESITIESVNDELGQENKITLNAQESSYTMPLTWSFGSRYNLSITASSEGIVCNFANTFNTGSMPNGNITSININCVPRTISACQAGTGVPWVANGTIYDTYCEGDNLYLFGSFSKIAPDLGYGFSTSLNNFNLPTMLENVNGAIYKVLSDGNGGWYIGGGFTSVGTKSRSYAAHINSNLTLDENFTTSGNSHIYDMFISNSDLYLIGSGGISVVNLATGSLKWRVTTTGYIYSSVLIDNILYIGGSFTSLTYNSNTSNLSYFNAFNISSKQFVTTNIVPNNAVYKIKKYNNSLILRGVFTSVTVNSNAFATNNIAMVGLDGTVNSNLGISTVCNYSIYTQSMLYDSTEIDGSNLYVYCNAAYKLKKIDLTTGLEISAFSQSSLGFTSRNGYAYFKIFNNELYVSKSTGDFLKLSLTDGSVISTYPIKVGANSFDFYQDKVYFGNNNTLFTGGLSRNAAVKINLKTMKPDETYDVGLNSGAYIYKVVKIGNFLYASGSIQTINNVSSPCVVSFGATDGIRNPNYITSSSIPTYSCDRLDADTANIYIASSSNVVKLDLTGSIIYKIITDSVPNQLAVADSKVYYSIYNSTTTSSTINILNKNDGSLANNIFINLPTTIAYMIPNYNNNGIFFSLSTVNYLIGGKQMTFEFDENGNQNLDFLSPTTSPTTYLTFKIGDYFYSPTNVSYKRDSSTGYWNTYSSSSQSTAYTKLGSFQTMKKYYNSYVFTSGGKFLILPSDP